MGGEDKQQLIQTWAKTSGHQGIDPCDRPAKRNTSLWGCMGTNENKAGQVMNNCYTHLVGAVGLCHPLHGEGHRRRGPPLVEHVEGGHLLLAPVVLVSLAEAGQESRQQADACRFGTGFRSLENKAFLQYEVFFRLFKLPFLVSSEIWQSSLKAKTREPRRARRHKC